MFTRRKLLSTIAAVPAAWAAGGLFTRSSWSGEHELALAAGPLDYPLGGADAPLSKLWVYNGTTPGPEIRVRRGERLRCNFKNQLEEASSIHWHGIRIINSMDGVSGLTQAAVGPGGEFLYEFELPDAGTYWYHAHNRSWNQVGRGLYGPLIIEEEKPVFDRDHDLTLMIDDWLVDENSVLHTASFGSLMHWSHAGRLGNWLTVNGKSLPGFSLNAGEHYRLRLINASNARVFAIETGAEEAMIAAFDGQALPEPLELSGTVFLAPAQRVDLVVTANPGGSFDFNEVTGSEPFRFARFEVEGDKIATDPAPRLPAADLPEPVLEGARTHQVRMSGGAMGDMSNIRYQGKVLDRAGFQDTGQLWAFNGVANMTDEPMVRLERGESVVFDIINDTAFPHGMHTHGHHFRIIENTGPDSNTQAWRDTLLIERGERAKIAFVADNPGKWLLHCHMLEHAAAGMMNWFEVA